MSLNIQYKYRDLKRYISHYFLASESKVFCNSLQKSGTHLLVNSVAELPKLKYYNRKVYDHTLTRLLDPPYFRSSPENVKKKIDTFYNGEVFRGHVEYNSELDKHFIDKNIKHILIVRNPFDVLVSLANWWEIHTEIHTSPFIHYKSLSGNFEKLNFLLSGGKMYNNEVWPSFIERYLFYKGWIDSKSTLILKFDDYQNSLQETFERIITFIYEESSRNYLNDKVFRSFKSGLEPQNSKTFINKSNKTFKEVPIELQDKYFELGGQKVNNLFGF